MNNIPQVILSMFEELKYQLMNESQEVIDNLKNCKDMCEYHHGLGRDIRNKWFWDENNDARKFFKSQGVWHADDMSRIFLDTWQMWLNNIEFDFIAYLKKMKSNFDEHWIKLKVNPNTGFSLKDKND